jgi:hypothetical protein
MDEIDYKQVAKDVLRLLDNEFDIGYVKSYLGWVTGKKIVWHTGNNYNTLCHVMRFLELPEPTEEEWEKR